jgi:hypothetical protein
MMGTEKRFVVFATRVISMTATVYAESEAEAREMAEDSLSVEWEHTEQEDSVDEVREEE